MLVNKIDKNINDKLKNRELKPSISAWERLNVQLEQEKTRKKRKKIQFYSYAASIALLISIGIFYLGLRNDDEVLIEETIVETSLDTFKIKEVNLKEELLNEKAIVKLTEENEKNKITAKTIRKKTLKEYDKVKINVIASTINESLKEVKDVENEKSIKLNDFSIKEEVVSQTKKERSTRIKINSDYLLFAVTHSPEEVKEYYAKYEINREEVLDVIEDELLKSNLKINPETILAEVELNIEESDFKQNFMSKLKLKLSDVIVAIADRNK